MKDRNTVRNNEQGFASIVIALILIIVLALLTIAFAQLARREQQNALNKQLSNQAYYAAESGINDAYKLIQSWTNTNTFPSPLPDKDVCLGTGVNKDITLDGAVDTNTGVSYSCVLLDLQPPTIEWQDVSPESDRTITFSTTGAINSLAIYWGSADGHTTPKTDNTKFLKLSDWSAGNYPPMIEVNLTRMGSSFNRQNLIDNTFSFYVYPGKGSGKVDFAPGSNPIVQAEDCTVPAGGNDFPCKVTINKLLGGSDTRFLVHIINHYDIANIVIGNAHTGENGSGPKVNIVNGQVQIDVTGKARNVLKRLQVRVPLGAVGDAGASVLPIGAIEGQSACKRLSVEQDSGSYENPYSGHACEPDYIDPSP